MLDAVPWRSVGKPTPRTRTVESRLALCGNGWPDGVNSLAYRIESKDRLLHEGGLDVRVTGGSFEAATTIKDKHPAATQVGYTLSAAGRPILKGVAPLRWSRFHGRLRYPDGRWRFTYAEMHPNGFRSIGSFYVPVADDGRFNALVPARVYSVINVNGAGYSFDAVERWAWDHDLTRDREDEFVVGRTELYSVKTLDIHCPLSTIFVMFCPTALSRVLRLDASGDGWVQGAEREAVLAAMRESPTIIGPELAAQDVRVWLNGNEARFGEF